MTLFARQFAYAKAAIEALGFAADRGSIGPDTADQLAAHVQARQDEAVSAATQELTAQLAEARSDIEAAQDMLQSLTEESAAAKSRILALSGALAAVGVAAGDDADGESIAEALSARVSTLAAERLAASGHTQPVTEAPASDPTRPAAPARTLSGLARTIEAMRARD